MVFNDAEMGEAEVMEYLLKNGYQEHKEAIDELSARLGDTAMTSPVLDYMVQAKKDFATAARAIATDSHAAYKKLAAFRVKLRKRKQTPEPALEFLGNRMLALKARGNWFR